MTLPLFKGEINKLLLLTEGDAKSPNTWSKVSYFFMNSLKAAGGIHEIVLIDISKFSWQYSLGLKMEAYFLVRRILPGNPTYTASRTKLYKRAVEKNIMQVIVNHEDADCLLSTNFSHSVASICSKKTCIFCDWTIDYLIEVMQHREPGILEKKSIEQQKKEIESADYIISLFPDVQEYMEKKYNESHETNIGVDIIGLNTSEATIFKSKNVYCYGYLSKGNIDQSNQYYDLLMHSKAIVNITMIWNTI